MKNSVAKINEWLQHKKISPIVFWFLLKVVAFYLPLDNFFTFYTGLTVHGGWYSSLLDNYFDFISAFRKFLLWGGAQFASLIGYPAGYSDYLLYVRDGASVRMVYSCLGFSLMSAYAALVLAWPTKWNYRIASLFLGTAIIIVLNMVRLGGLAVLYTTGHYGFFDYINHHDLFNIIVLVVVFLMFMIHVNYSDKREMRKVGENELMMKVVFFHRKAYPHQFSIERVFDGIPKYIQSPDHFKWSGDSIQTEKAVMPFFSSGILPRIKNVLWSRKHQGDINHITGDVHYIALGLNKRKTILTIHDLNFLNHPNSLTRFILKTFWLTLPLKRVAYVTVISEATKKDLLARIKFPENRIKVISNYYDVAFQPSTKEFNKVKPRILQIGTKENKNVFRLIEALKEINCHLTIVGGNNEKIKNHLRQYSVSYTWLQNLTDAELIEQYKQCDVLSFVSTIEGFGMPILEAQAIGRVVITSNISSMPEVAGDAACYVNPFDVDSIRNGIIKVIQNDDYKNELIEKGFVNVKRFELIKISNLYLDLYKNIIA